MDLATTYPVFGLKITAGDLVLRPITDDVLPSLIDLALRGVHEPGRMPFMVPWTDAPAADLPASFARYHWSLRANWRTDAWSLEFAVEWQGTIVGVQGLTGHDYRVTRQGETGSWLGLEYHGHGIGTRMRQAICAFAFDELGAEVITSGSYVDNPASGAVSRKVGYVANGQDRKTRRPGEWQLHNNWLLTRETFVRGEPVVTEGVAAFRCFIGLDVE